MIPKKLAEKRDELFNYEDALEYLVNRDLSTSKKSRGLVVSGYNLGFNAAVELLLRKADNSVRVLENANMWFEGSEHKGCLTHDFVVRAISDWHEFIGESE